MVRDPANSELLRWLYSLSPADRRVLAHGWQLDPISEAPEILAAMTDAARVTAILERLSPAERDALTAVLGAGGSLPVAIVERGHGAVREPANFPHPRSYLEALTVPPSATERLYLLGLIQRQYDQRGPIFRVPPALMPLLPPVPLYEPRLAIVPTEGAVVPAAVAEPPLDGAIFALLMLAYEQQLNVVGDGGLSKAAMRRFTDRIGLPDGQRLGRESDLPWLGWLRASVFEAGLVRRGDDGRVLVMPAALVWLQADAASRVRTVLNGWLDSAMDELILLCKRRWRSTPLNLELSATRRTLLRLLGSLPREQWCNVDDVVRAVQAADPYFLRRDGRFDTWLVYDDQNRLLGGEGDWEAVEGTLVRQVCVSILTWLGLSEAGTAEDGQVAVRLTALGANILQDAPAPAPPAVEKLVVQSTMDVICPPDASLYARFQLARISEAGDVPHVYRLTRRSILRAAGRGIDAANIVRFLQTAAESELPAVVQRMIEEWCDQADQIRIAPAMLMRAEPMLLAELRRTRALTLPAYEPLSDGVWAFEEGDGQVVVDRLRQAGYGVAGDVAAAAAPLAANDLQTIFAATLAYATLSAEHGSEGGVPAALLSRLRRLLPTRQAEEARRQAELLVGQLHRSKP
ncbi:MAG: hypothetical protein NVS4B8_06770 [Herpetosiphon sp.]